jgi:hypothetical protein
MLKGEFHSDCSRFRTESPAFWGTAFTCNSPCAVDTAKELLAPPTSILPAVSAFTTASAGQSRREQCSLLRSLRQPLKMGIWNRKSPHYRPSLAPGEPVQIGRLHCGKHVFGSPSIRASGGPSNRGVPAALGRGAGADCCQPRRRLAFCWGLCKGATCPASHQLFSSIRCAPANRTGKCCKEGVGRSNE